jgi:hypothetical protein
MVLKKEILNGIFPTQSDGNFPTPFIKKLIAPLCGGSNPTWFRASSNASPHRFQIATMLVSKRYLEWCQIETSAELA